MESSVIEKDPVEVKKYMANFVPINNYRSLGDEYLYQVRATLLHSGSGTNLFSARYEDMFNEIKISVGDNSARISSQQEVWADLFSAGAKRTDILEAHANNSSAAIEEIREATASTNAAQAKINTKLQASFDDIIVGGRNLIVNSTFAKGYDTWSESVITPTDHYIGKMHRIAPVGDKGSAYGIMPLDKFKRIRMVQGTQYSLSFYGFGSVLLLDQVYLVSAEGDLTKLPNITMSTDLTERRHITFTAPIGGDAIGFIIGATSGSTEDWFTIAQLKLELGTKPSDWTPAPEDVDGYISEVQSTIDDFKEVQISRNEATATAIQALDSRVGDNTSSILSERKTNANRYSTLTQTTDRLSGATGDNKARIEEVNTVITNQYETIATKITTLEAETELGKGKIESLEEVTSNTQEVVATTSKNLNAKIEGIGIGGRNLLRNANFKLGHKLWGTAASTESENILGNLITVTNVGDETTYFGFGPEDRYKTIHLVAGREYVLSFYAEGSIPALNDIWISSEGNGVIKLPDVPLTTSLGERTELVFISEFTAENCTILIGANSASTNDWFGVVAVKLEQGNKATDWTEAPEDTRQAIDTVEANINEFRQVQVDHNKATTTAINTMESTLGENSAKIVENYNTLVSKDESMAKKHTSLSAEFGLNKTKVSNEIKAVADDVSASVESISTLKAEFEDNKTGVDSSIKSLATENTAQTKRMDNLYADIGVNSAAIASEVLARTTEDEAIVKSVNALSTRTENAEGRISKAETAISTNSGAMAQQKTDLTAAYTKAIDDLEIGGRNLLENSNRTEVANPREFVYWHSIKHALDKMEIGEEFTISFDVQMTKGSYLKAYCGNKKGDRLFLPHKTFRDIGTEKQRLSFTTKVVEADGSPETDTAMDFYSSYDSGDFFEISNLKFERGNKATDYTPAPEDTISYIDGEIATVITKVESKADISRVDTVESNAEKALASAKTELTGEYSTAITTAKKQSADDAQAKADAASKSAKDYTDQKIVIVNEVIDSKADISRVDSIENSTKESIATAKTELSGSFKQTITETVVSGEEYARLQAEEALKKAKLDATAKASEAKSSAEIYAAAQAEAKRIEAEAYADGIVTAEEARAIEDARLKLEQAKTDATTKANAAELAAKQAAALDATNKANKALLDAKADSKLKADAAKEAAQKYAETQAEAKRVLAEAYADGIVTDEEQKRIDDVNAKLALAKKDATDKAEAAKQAAITAAALDATQKANQAKKDANAYTLVKFTEADASIKEIKQITNNANQSIVELGQTVESNFTSSSTLVETVKQELVGKIDSIEIGGRNLLTDSNDMSRFNTAYSGSKVSVTSGITVSEWGAVDASEVTVSGGSATLKSTPQMLARGSNGKKMTYSFYAKNSGSTDLRFSLNGFNNITANRSLTLAVGESAKFVVTGFMRSDYDWFQHQIYTTETTASAVLWRLKLEYGDKATDWTPAPEDLLNAAETSSNAAREAAITFAKAEAEAKRVLAESYADGIVTKEEEARIKEANANLVTAKTDATNKANAAKQAAETYAKAQADQALSDAKVDAQEKADAAKSAANLFATAEAEAKRVIAQAYADNVVTAEEERAIKDANDKLALAKADANTKANAARDAAKSFATLEADRAITAAQTDATKKANAAKLAAETFATTEAEAKQILAQAYADGIVTAEEERAIKDANDKLAAAKLDATTKANAANAAAKTFATLEANRVLALAKTDAQTKADAAKSAAQVFATAEAEAKKVLAQAYADGKITAEEERAIKDASDKLALAQADATTKANEAKQAAIKAAAADATDKANKSLSDSQALILQAVEGIEIGGRNLLENSNRSIEARPREFVYWLNIQDALEKAGVGTTITISFDVQMDKGDYLRVYCGNRDGQLMFSPHKTFTNIGTDKQRLSFETTVTNHSTPRYDKTAMDFYSNYDSGDFFTISNLKIEKGNKATDWSPAPEDLQSNAEKLATEAKEAAQVFATTKAEAERVKAEAYADGKVTAEEQARIAEVDAKYKAALLDSTQKSDAAKNAAILAAATDAKTKADNALASAKSEATRLSNLALDAAKVHANTKAEAERLLAEAHADGIVTIEEEARIKQANAVAEAAKLDATKKADAAKNAAVVAAAADADSKVSQAVLNSKAEAVKLSNEALAAAKVHANAQAAAERLIAEAHADNIVTAEEQARIAQALQVVKDAKADASSKANEAQAAAIKAAALDATAKADKAKKDAEAAAKTFTTTEVTKANSRIDTLSTSINDAKQSLVEQGNKITSNFNSTTTLIESTKKNLDEKIDGIEIGGRNLMLNSALLVHKLGDNSHAISSGVKSGVYTLSFDYEVFIENEVVRDFLVYCNSHSVARVPTKLLGQDRTSVTFEINDDDSDKSIYLYANSYSSSSRAVELNFINIKLEKGNKASDWTPAPEDTTDYVDKGLADAKTTSEQYAAQKADEALTAANNNTATKAGEAQDAAEKYALAKAKAEADAALVSAKSDATTKANAAKSAAEATAALDAKNKADKALADAKLDATAKANAAKEHADKIVSSLKTVVDSKATIEQLNTVKNDANQALASTKTELTGNYTSAITSVRNDLTDYADLKTSVVPINSTTKKFINPVGTIGPNSVTGYLIIETPITPARMCTVKFSGYNYSGRNSNIDLSVGFYHYSTGTLQSDFNSTGSYPIEKVQIGRASDTTAVIIIGLPDSVWKYIRGMVSEAIIGYSGTTPDSYINGWDIKFGTDISSYSHIVNVPGSHIRTDLSNLKADVDSKASISRVDTVENNAKQALATAKTELTGSYTTAISTAKSQSATDAQTRATKALNDAKADTVLKANAARTAAETYALAEAKAKADAALVTAKSDATEKASAAESAAKAAAALDAKNKADKALADAKIDAKAKADEAERLAKVYADGKVNALSKVVDSKANISRVDTVENDAKQALATAKTELTSSYTEAIDKIEIGGRNLLENTNREVYSGHHSRAEYTKWGFIQDALEKVPVGSDITISFDVVMAKGSYLQVYCNNTIGATGFSPSKSFSNIGTNKQRLSFVTKVVEGSTSTRKTELEFYSIYGTEDWYTVSNVKIEKGNKSTDWTPAPEDVTDYVDTSVSTLKTLVDSKASISRVDTVENNANQAVASAKTALTGSYTTAISVAKGESATDAQTRASQALKDAKVDATGKANEAERLAKAHADTKVAALTKVVDSKASISSVEAVENTANNAIASLRTDLTASYKIKDTRSTNELPSYYYSGFPNQVIREFKYKSVMDIPAGAGSYVYVETTIKWGGTSGGAVSQEAITDDNRVFTRTSSSNTWRAWIEQENTTGSAAKVAALKTALDKDIQATDARITAEKKVAADATSAVASTVSKLSTTVNGHTSSINETKQSLNGLSASWSMETNVNGKVSGIYQHSTGKRSSLEIITDKFTLSNGTNAGYAPFRQEGSTTYLNMAVIKDASIDTAKIANLAVDTLQIANGAVTIPIIFRQDSWVEVKGAKINKPILYVGGSEAAPYFTTSILATFSLNVESPNFAAILTCSIDRWKVVGSTGGAQIPTFAITYTKDDGPHQFLYSIPRGPADQYSMYNVFLSSVCELPIGNIKVFFMLMPNAAFDKDRYVDVTAVDIQISLIGAKK